MTETRVDPDRLDGALLQASRMWTRSCLQAGLRHDLKVPLNALRITLALLADKLSALDLVGQRYLRVLEEELQQLSQLLARAFEDADDGVRDFELGDVLGRLGILLAPFAARQGVALRVDGLPPGTRLPLRGRPGWLEQAFLNVAVGRLEILGAGGHLHIVTEPARAAMRIVFIDDGAPMDGPPSTLESLALRPGEDALGQFVAARVAKSFGGSLAVGTGPGGWLCFELPLAAEGGLAPGATVRAA